MNQRKIGIASILALIVIAVFLAQPLAFAATVDTSSGTATVSNDVPTITSPSFTDTVPTSKNGAQIDVWAEYWIQATVEDLNKLTDLNYIKFIIWGPSSTEGGADDEADHYTFTYTQSTDSWAEVGPGASDEHLISGNSVDPANQQLGSGVFKLAFKLAKIAEHTDTATWSIKIIAMDDQATSDSDSSLTFGVNYYAELVINDGTHAWSGQAPGSNDVLITTPGNGKIDVTITSNNAYTLQAKGNGALVSGGNTIPLINVEIHATTLGSAVGLTTSYANIGGLTSQSAGASQAKSFKLWISMPSPQEGGDYTYILSIQVIEAT